MGKIESFLYSLSFTKWFFVKSWLYVVTRDPRSKIEYFKGIIPAWFRFMYYTNIDLRSMKGDKL